MTSASSEILRLLQKVDRAPTAPSDNDSWTKLLSRADAVRSELVARFGPPIARELLQDQESFVQYTKWTAASGEPPKLVFSLLFSLWGDLVCINHDADIADENDLATVEQCPEILERHGFVPVTYEQLQASYTGEIYDKKFIPDDATWHWRFFDFH